MAHLESVKSISSSKSVLDGRALNILMLGETQVGKTALIKMYNGEKFPIPHYTTLGTEFIVKELNVNGEIAKAKIWDTAGQERFRTIAKSFYQQAQGIILAYDVTNRESYNKLTLWLQNINEKADANVVKFLVANKVDLVDDRVVTPDEGKSIAKQFDLDYYETSAKMNKNVKEVFEAIITKAHLTKRLDPDKNSFQLKSKSASAKKGACC